MEDLVRVEIVCSPWGKTRKLNKPKYLFVIRGRKAAGCVVGLGMIRWYSPNHFCDVLIYNENDGNCPQYVFPGRTDFFNAVETILAEKGVPKGVPIEPDSVTDSVIWP
jgi:hypothetical protein